MKKEMKKVLSLVLALAMVLSTCTFVIANGKDALPADDLHAVATQKMVYDFAEFFVTTNTFTGNPAEDYTSAGLKEYMVGNTAWNVEDYWDGGDKAQHNHKWLFRAGEASRAWSDTKNTTLTLKSGATNSTERIPNMVYTYQNSHASTLDTAKNYYHYDGTAGVVTGDGGIAAVHYWPYGGSIGYGFGNGTGYPNMSPASRVQQAVVFTAPRAGFINPEIRIYTNNNTHTAYRIYRRRVVSGKEVWTNIYPAEGTGSTITASYALDEHEANGWITLASKTTEVKKDALVWVEEGEQLVLRIASANTTNGNTGISLDTLKMNYVDEREFRFFPDTRTVDLRVDFLPDDVTYTPATADLIATDVAGVFTVADTYVAGTAIPVTIDTETESVTINIKLTPAIYDVAEGFYTANTYASGATGVEKYPAVSQTPKFANDGSSIWTFGHYEYNNLTKLYLYDKLQRWFNTRAYEDTTATVNTAGTYSETAEQRAARQPIMTWIGTTNYIYKEGDEGKTYATVDPDGGYSISTANARFGSIGFTFGAENYMTAGFGSQSGSAGNAAHPTVIFTAPIDGVINPVMQAGAATANTIAYRMYKVDSQTGAYTQIYPMWNDDKVHLSTEWGDTYPVSDIVNNNWAYLPANSWLTQDMGAVRVNKGDKIYLRFAGVVNSKGYALNKLEMNYLGRFGEDDELLLVTPMEDYEEKERILVYPDDPFIDLSREILNPEAEGTIEYSVSGKRDALYETATPGVFVPTGVINLGGIPATVTAGYYSKGKSSAKGDKPMFTTSIDVYVDAASLKFDTFKTEVFKASQIGYDSDGFILPYYANATERAIYGEIDLGFTDAWKNSTVTISDPSKIQYLGNGRIRVLAKHDFKDAGGTYPNHSNNVLPGLQAPDHNGNHAVRSPETAGKNPIVMTVKAPDGGQRKFYLWTLTTNAQGNTPSESYSITHSAYNTPNAVTALEGFIDMTAANGGSFKKMYRDNGDSSQITPASDDMYLSQAGQPYWHTRVPAFDGTTFYFWAYNQRDWATYTNAPYIDYDGVAWAFTAPKAGTLELSKHLTDVMFRGSNYHWYTNATFMGYVRKYAADGTYENLLEITYNNRQPLTITVPATTAGGTPTSVQVNTEAAETGRKYLGGAVTGGTMASSYVNQDSVLQIPVEKGEIIRVILACDKDSAGAITSYALTSSATGSVRFLPQPVFTYLLGTPDAYNGDTITVTPNKPADADDVLALFYDANGNMIGSVNGATANDGHFTIDAINGSAYARIFFWDSLTNIQPVAGDVVVRK